MKKKLFIAINPPAEIRKKLSLFKKKFWDIPAKWTKENKIHMTLLFVGFVVEEKEKELIVLLENVSKKSDVFDLIITNLSYAPSESRAPRMIWANIEKSDLLVALTEKLEVEIDNFQPHITLARINTWQFNKINPEEVPTIEEEINISFKIYSIELMESKMIRGEAEYETLESFQLCHRL